MEHPPEYDPLPASPTLYRQSYIGASQEALTPHKYRLSPNGSILATLKFASRARYRQDPPCFIEGDDISGTLDVNLEGAHVQAITISVKGRLIVDTLKPGDYTEVFLNIEQLLWTEKSGSVASGTRILPFSIKLPLDVKLRSKLTGTNRVYNLPRSFPKAYGVVIHYEISVVFARGRFRSNLNLGTAFSYDPLSPPEPLSMLRQFAYQDGTPLVGPEGDPKGWTALQPMRIRGTIFDSRLVDAKCTLYLANPLCYTRGSVIPCSLKLESDDPETLDLIASPVAFPVRLLRVIVASPKPSLPPKDVFEHLESAVWWPSSMLPNMRILSGEIRLSENLEPSTALSIFAIIYSVVVFPFEAFAFKAMSKEPWVSKTVEITTTYAAGPRPIPNVPPGYEVIRKPTVLDYQVPMCHFV